MNRLKVGKVGALSPVLLTLIYMVGLVMNFTMLDTTGISDSVGLIDFIAERQGLMYAWITLLYVVFGFVLIWLSVSLNVVLAEKDGKMAQFVLILGVIWSGLLIASGMVHNVGMGLSIKWLPNDPVAAANAYAVVRMVQDGLGGGNEIVGALWTLAISFMGHRYGLFDRWVNIMGFIIGFAGVLTIVPAWFDTSVMVFALGQMVWWIGLSKGLMRAAHMN